jgi:hypothetical protein
MNKLRIFILSIVCAISFPSVCEGYPRFTITNPRFSSGYNGVDREPVNLFNREEIAIGDLTDGRVYFSCLIQGDLDTLNAIEEIGALNVQGSVFFDLNKTLPDIEFGIDQEAWLKDRDGLYAQCREDGVFTWRTYFWFSVSRTERLPSKIEVSIWSSNRVVRRTNSLLSCKLKLNIIPQR